MTAQLKNIPFGTVLNLAGMIDYAHDRVARKSLSEGGSPKLILFAFDRGQGLDTHTAPGNALVQIIEGTGKIILDGSANVLHAGDVIVLPAGTPHSVHAEEPFKMLLILVLEQASL